MKKWILTVWLLLSFFNFGVINANIKALNFHCDVMTARERYAETMLFSMVPVVSTFYAIFGTGFAEQGFDWTLGTCKVREGYGR